MDVLYMGMATAAYCLALNVQFSLSVQVSVLDHGHFPSPYPVKML